MFKIPDANDKNVKSVYRQDQAKRKFTKRPCLGVCGQMMLSEGAHNRICKSCLSKDIYRGIDEMIIGQT